MKHEPIASEMRVSIKEAKNRLPALVRAVETGVRVIITRNGKPVAEIIPNTQKGGIDWDGLRKWKEAQGLPRIVAEMAPDFDDPLPADFLIRPLP
jgi:prevent-host-death family protein